MTEQRRTTDPWAVTKRRWQKIATGRLVGRTIVAARWMTDEERQAHQWRRCAVQLLLDDGTILWPSADDEGNEAGVLFGVRKEGDVFRLPVL